MDTDALTPPSDQEYWAAAAKYNKLCYFQQPEGQPHLQVSVSQGDKRIVSKLTLIDGGANVGLIGLNPLTKAGIPCLPTQIRLTTSNGSATRVKGITPPLLATYGAGPNKVEVYHQFLVTEGMEHLYEVLLSNLDTLRFGGELSARTCQYSLSAQFQLLGDKAPSIHLPTEYRPAGRQSFASSHPSRTCHLSWPRGPR